MLGWVAHYKNKFPGSHVQVSESAFDVYSADGEHLVALRKNGANQWNDESEKYGCVEKHCLAPIPKDSRVHKEVDGKISFDEKHEERREKRQAFLRDGKIASMAELKSEGYSFDEAGRVVGQPEKK